MEWNNDEQQNIKQGMSLSSKILLGIISCIILIIILIFMLLMNIKETSFSILVDENAATTTKELLLTTIDNTTYVNIEEFAKLVGYEYHAGEYKSYIAEADKCYVEGTNETASFYVNDNKVYKLPVDKLEEEYQEYKVENAIKNVNEKIYAPIEAIAKAFNVVLDETSSYLKIYTLDYLINLYDAKVTEWGYQSIAEQSFENDKALLYGYLVVKKENGLYKIIDLENTKEIVLARYTSIEFSENMQEFLVKDSSNQVGIINQDGKTKLEIKYESVEVLSKANDLYLIKQNSKYGVVKSDDIIVIFPEYDTIGITNSNITSNKYLILDTLIPVYKNQKWGAYNKEGKLVLSLEYQGLGYDLTNVEIDGIKESVQPVLEIERANGVVVKKDDKYGLMNLNGEELVPIAVDAIYALDEEDEDSKYFMLYNGRKLNVIERLITAGLLEESTNENEKIENTITNGIENQ